MNLAASVIDDSVSRALREDLEDGGDLTTRLALPGLTGGTARVFAKADGVIAGIPVAERVFLAQDPDARIEVVCAGDGARVAAGDDVMRISGSVGALLVAERTALNFLQRLSGIATLTAAFVDAVEGTGVRILDTRKTTPTLRALEKYAVRIGGGDNHRIGLYDQVLLKENHFGWSEESYEAVVARCVAGAHGDAPVVAEARDYDEAAAAVRGGAGVVLLDNFPVPDGLKQAVATVRATAAELGRPVLIEASGGMTLDTVRGVAECGVDRISVGALTHSAGSLDLSMLVQAEGR